MKTKFLVKLSIGCLIVAAAMSLFALAGLLFQFATGLFTTPYWYVVFTLIIIMAASLLVRNALDILAVVKNIPVLLTIPLVTLSALFGIICIWGAKAGTIVNITISVAVIAIVMLIISTQRCKLGNQKLGLQIPGYALFCVAVLLTLALIWGLIPIVNVIVIFLMAVCYIVGGVLVIILGVVSKKVDIAVVNDQYIKIKKSEYEALLQELEILRGQNK